MPSGLGSGRTGAQASGGFGASDDTYGSSGRTGGGFGDDSTGRTGGGLGMSPVVLFSAIVN